MNSSSSEKLGPRQLDQLTAAHDLAGARVELEVGKAQRLARAVGRAAQERAQPGEKLLERERLRHVVVGAGVESLDAVLDLRARSEHQDRHGIPVAANRPADLQAVHAGHQHVEQDGVDMAVRSQPLERLTPVAGQLDLVALELESPLERLPHRAPSSSTIRIFTTPIVRADSENFLKRPSRSYLVLSLVSGPS
jgi:hypothetical protein